MKCKNLLLISAFIFSSNALFSQTEIINSKSPSAGNVMFELNFTPFSQEKVISFDQIQAKYWVSDAIVLRMGLGFDINNNKLTADDYDSSILNKPTVDEHSLMFALKPGFEYRFLKNSKISPYVGLEFQYKNKNSNSKYIDYVDYNYPSTGYAPRVTEIDGGWRGNFTAYYYSNGIQQPYDITTYTNQRAYSSLGGNLLFGSDFYFVRNMYFGFEVGLGYESINYKPVTVKISTQVDEEKLPSSSASKFAFNYNGAIRFGVWF